MTDRDPSAKTWGMLRLYPSHRWARSMVRSPLLLWRLGLGPIVGKIMLVLTTTGRLSGLPRRTMLEYHSMKGRKYVVSAFGQRSQWYRNLQADPGATIQTADGTESVRAVRVNDNQELLAVFELFKRRDAPMLLWYLKSLDIAAQPEDVLAKRDRIHFLRFEPTEEAAPPGLAVDLGWMWALFAVAMLAAWLLIKGIRRSLLQS